jgi:hypothetical protein
MSDHIHMDQDGMVIYSYLNEKAELRWGWKLYESKAKKKLLDWGKGYPRKGGAFLAMKGALNKQKSSEN